MTTTSSSPYVIPERDGTVELPGGRVLGFTELGDLSGDPVVVLDGPGSRGLARAAAAGATDAGVRLIAPDRPGWGASTPVPDRAIVDFTADLAALADHLGIERFGVIGQSGGTPYALSAGARLGDRVKAIALCGGIVPLGE